MDTKNKALSLLLSKEQKDSLDFENLLDLNIKNVCELLQIDHTQIHNLILDLSYSSDSSQNPQWKFICLCFYILLLPDEESEVQNVIHLANVKKAFQFIVSLGLIPNLIRGVGIEIKLRFKNIDVFPFEEIDIKDKYYRLRSVTNLMIKCLEIDTLRTFIVENHMNDILAALLQLTSAPLKQPNTTNKQFHMSEQFYLEVLKDRKNFQSIQHDLILTIHQPVIFRELMFLNGNKKSPIWLKNSVLEVLMERVQTNNGVESLIRALFDADSEDTGINWKHWDILTKLLMTKPNYVNKDEYYSNICSQLILLLNKRTFDGYRIPKYENAVILCTKYLFEINENICRIQFLNPLFQILLDFTNSTNINKIGIVTQEIEQIMFILHSIFVENKPNDKIISISSIEPILAILSNLYFISFNLKPKLNSDIINILEKYLSNEDGKQLYENLLFGTEIKNIPTIKTGYSFVIVKNDILFDSKEIICDIFLRSESCIHLLENTKNEDVINSFFAYLLEIFLNSFQNITIAMSIDLAERKIIIYQLLLKLLENKIILKNLKKNPSELLIFTENFLKLIIDKNIHKSTDYDGEDFQTLFILIMVVNNLIKNCDKSILKEHNILTNILKKVSIETLNNELKLLVNEVFILNDDSFEKNRSEYEEAIDEICSSLIPEQAHGLATIVKLIEQRDPETCCKKQYVLNIFQQHLKSEESFIYLRAIAGLAALTDAFPKTILESLTDEYLYPKGVTEKDTEIRMKLGEVLLRVTSSLGEDVVKYKGLLLNTFLSAVKDPDPLIRASSLSNLGEVCKVLGFRLGTIVTEILYCIHDIISHELAVEVRRAAVSVIRQLFIGLGKEMIAFLKEDILAIYRTLKTVYYDDPDAITRLQAQLALEELNEIMRSLVGAESDTKKNFVIPDL